jgi:hypothetical protein
MTYLMNHVTSLNNTCGWSYKLPHVGCCKLVTNWFVAKSCPKENNGKEKKRKEKGMVILWVRWCTLLKSMRMNPFIWCMPFVPPIPIFNS